MVRAFRFQNSVLWLQVFGLAALQGAITLTWVVYNLYLPKLLGQFGFPKEFAVGLLVVENALAIALEPLMGGLSDRTRHHITSRYPFIIFGVALASALFISLPAIAIFADPSSVLRWVFVSVTVVWSIAMTVFRSPALVLLANYASKPELPQAASVVNLVGVAVGALGLLPINQFLVSLNPMVVFAIASIGLLAAATVLLKLDARVAAPQEKQPIVLRNLGLIFLVGVSVGVGSALIRRVLNPNPAPTVAFELILFTVTQLVIMIPAGAIASRFGNQRAMVIGIGAMLGSLGLFSIAPGLLGVVGLGIGSGLVVNGTIPFALNLMPKSGLGIGLYFGGAALASSVLGAVTLKMGPVSNAIASSVGAIALFVAGAAIVLSKLWASRDRESHTRN